MKKGDRIPDISFRTRSLGEWKNVSTDDYFKGKRVILFALPGAFTLHVQINNYLVTKNYITYLNSMV